MDLPVDTKGGSAGGSAAAALRGTEKCRKVQKVPESTYYIAQRSKEPLWTFLYFLYFPYFLYFLFFSVLLCASGHGGCRTARRTREARRSVGRRSPGDVKTRLQWIP